MFDKTNTLFISWIGFHGRSQGIADALGIDAVYIDSGRGNLLVRYLRNWRETRALLRSSSADNVIVMMPPTPALLAVTMSRPRGRGLVIGDLHTGVFTDPKWRPFLGLTLRVLRRRGLAIVTNESLAERVRAAGTTALVLHDMTEEWDRDTDSAFDDAALIAATAKPFILTPLAYAHDEPLTELLEAARLSPTRTFIWTGRAPEAIRAQAPSNVRFSGFTTKADFSRLLSRCSAVLAITTEEDTMQRAGYEALNIRTGLVTSDMRVLREYFGDVAVYAEPTAASLSAAVETVLGDPDAHAARMAELRTTKLVEQARSLDELRELLG